MSEVKTKNISDILGLIGYNKDISGGKKIYIDVLIYDIQIISKSVHMVDVGI